MPEPYELYKKSSGATPSPIEVKLEVGMMGFSVEDITKGRRGYAILPLGSRDSTKWGGRKWVKIKVTAMEDVRANRDIIVGNEQGEIKEHTPVELSYEKHPAGAGSYQRVGEDYPLPITANSNPPTFISKIATALGTTLIATPASGKKIRVIYFSFSNADNNQSVCGLKFATSGDINHRYSLAADGGAVSINLVNSPCEGGADESLYANLDAANVSGVYITVGYLEI